MPLGIKVALPGYNALTDTDPSHFSLYIDGTDDHILVKEIGRGQKSVSATSTTTTAHNLGYPPLLNVFADFGTGEFQWTYGFSPYNDYRVYVDTTNYYIQNTGGSTVTFFFLLFYDKVQTT